MGVAALHFHVASLSGFGFVDSVLFFIEKTCFLDLRAHEFQSHFQPQAAIVRAIFTTWMFFLQEETYKETFKDANRSGQEWAVRVKRIISLSEVIPRELT